MKGIKIAMGCYTKCDDDFLTFAQQMGLKYVQIHVPTFEDQPGYWRYDDLARMVEKVDSYGIKLLSIENTPHEFYDKLLLGLPGREQQLENYCKCIENMGKAGIPILGYHFMANGVWRTSFSAKGRGGTEFSAYDHAIAEGGYKECGGGGDEVRGLPEEKLWENYEYFIKGILPTAAQAGVKLAMHPDDPPVAQIDGVNRLLYSVDQYKKAWKIAGGHPNWGLDFCIGTISEMGGSKTVNEIIDFFTPKGHIFYCHFRDVQGCVSDGRFQECWMGEGNYNPAQVLVALSQKGFDGHLIDDHVGRMAGDDLGRRAHAREIGYMQGLVCMADYLMQEA